MWWVMHVSVYCRCSMWWVMGDRCIVYCVFVFRSNHANADITALLMMLTLMQTSQLRAVLHPRKQEKRIMMTLLYGVVSVLFGRISEWSEVSNLFCKGCWCRWLLCGSLGYGGWYHTPVLGDILKASSSEPHHILLQYNRGMRARTVANYSQ